VNFLFASRQRAQGFLCIIVQGRVLKHGRQVAEWPANIAFPEVDDLRCPIGVAPDIEPLIQEQDGDVDTVQNVGQVALGQRKIVKFGLQLRIDGLRV